MKMKVIRKAVIYYPEGIRRTIKICAPFHLDDKGREVIECKYTIYFGKEIAAFNPSYTDAVRWFSLQCRCAHDLGCKVVGIK